MQPAQTVQPPSQLYLRVILYEESCCVGGQRQGEGLRGCWGQEGDSDSHNTTRKTMSEDMYSTPRGGGGGGGGHLWHICPALGHKQTGKTRTLGHGLAQWDCSQRPELICNGDSSCSTTYCEPPLEASPRRSVSGYMHQVDWSGIK